MDGKPFGVVHFFAGGTKDQYEASIAAVHPADGLACRPGLSRGGRI